MNSFADSSTTSPPTSALDLRIASSTMPIGTPYARSLAGSTVTWYCLTNPPMLATSATPGTEASPYRRYQSWYERSSWSERWSEVTVYSNTQPTPVASG